MENKIIFILVLFQCIFTNAQTISNDTLAHRYLVFINGHRGPKNDKDIASNNIKIKDSTGYWMKYDDAIIKRFPSSKALYLDGHNSIKTSMQRNFVKITASYLGSRFCWFSKKSRWIINPKVNAEGFLIRMKNGAEAGKNYLNLSCNTQKCNTVKDTIDIVCHSFGYAYSIGFIDAIKNKVVFGKILIMAPESANYWGADWTMFQEVWQYGCNNLGNANSEVICHHDGIAPQQQVLGLELMMPNNGGRVFIPENAKKGFIRSHHLDYWSWFFDIKSTDYGYFTR